MKIELFYLAVAGVKFHQLSNIKDKVKPGDIVTLEREPNNPYDPNAIKISIYDTIVGYIPKRWTEIVGSVMEDHKEKLEVVVRDYNPDSEKTWLSLVIQFNRKD